MSDEWLIQRYRNIQIYSDNYSNQLRVLLAAVRSATCYSTYSVPSTVLIRTVYILMQYLNWRTIPVRTAEPANHRFLLRVESEGRIAYKMKGYLHILIEDRNILAKCVGILCILNGNSHQLGRLTPHQFTYRFVSLQISKLLWRKALFFFFFLNKHATASSTMNYIRVNEYGRISKRRAAPVAVFHVWSQFGEN